MLERSRHVETESKKLVHIYEFRRGVTANTMSITSWGSLKFGGQGSYFEHNANEWFKRPIQVAC
jgi:hypothetical protein